MCLVEHGRLVLPLVPLQWRGARFRYHGGDMYARETPDVNVAYALSVEELPSANSPRLTDGLDIRS